jgi:hypothetical protein
MNVGEEICGEWLRHVRGCEFVQYNLKTTEVQGEVDVIGLNMKERTVYACEVAIHLITGLQYTKEKRPDNVPRLTAKFRKDIQYLRTAFPEYQHVLMLWSPIVKNQRDGSKYNQMADVQQIVDNIQAECRIGVELMINEDFRTALKKLRSVAGTTSKELDSSVMRYLQVEERLAAHLRRE